MDLSLIANRIVSDGTDDKWLDVEEVSSIDPLGETGWFTVDGILVDPSKPSVKHKFISDVYMPGGDVPDRIHPKEYRVVDGMDLAKLNLLDELRDGIIETTRFDELETEEIVDDWDPS